GTTIKDLVFSRNVILQVGVVPENFLARAGLGDAQNLAEKLGHFDHRLMREDMTELVAQDSGQLVFVARDGNEFSRNIHTPAGQAERVGDRQIRKEELNSQFGRRRVLEQPLSDTLHIAGVVRIVDDQKLALYVFSDGVAYIHFLAVGKHVGAGIGRKDANWLARLLRAQRAGVDQEKQKRETASNGCLRRGRATQHASHRR